MKCEDRWIDPAATWSENRIGPYSCGRPKGHPGVHAHQGHGALAAWDDDGVLLLSMQRIAAPTRRHPATAPRDDGDLPFLDGA